MRNILISLPFTALQVGALQLNLTGVYIDGAGNKIADCLPELPREEEEEEERQGISTPMLASTTRRLSR